MKSNQLTIAAVFLFLFGIALTGTALAKDELIIVATTKTFEASEEWAEFLKEQEIPIKHITPQAFEANKKAPFVVIMGSLDEAGGVKSLVAECLTKTEYQLASQPDTGEVFFKSKIWDPSQSVIVITGSNWPSVEAARIDYREQWLDEFGKWFDMELSGPTMHTY